MSAQAKEASAALRLSKTLNEILGTIRIASKSVSESRSSVARRERHNDVVAVIAETV
jgi:hypothetical protein